MELLDVHLIFSEWINPKAPYWWHYLSLLFSVGNGNEAGALDSVLILLRSRDFGELVAASPRHLGKLTLIWIGPACSMLFVPAWTFFRFMFGLLSGCYSAYVGFINVKSDASGIFDFF